MALTEIAFEVADASFPLAELTRAQHDVDVAFRAGLARATGFHGIALVLAPREVTRGLDKAGGAAIGSWTTRVLAERAADADVAFSPLDGSPLVPDAVAGARRAFGAAALVTPVRLRRGVARVRVLAPGRVDARDAGVRLRRALGDAGNVRVARVTPVTTAAFETACRGVLNVVEEDVLALAWEMGYYAKPKGCNLEDIAARRGVSASPVHKRLKSAEHALVTAHATPAGVSAKRLRATGRTRVSLAPAPVAGVGLTDARVAVRVPDSPILEASRECPRARILAHPTGADDARAGAASLLAVSGPDMERARVIATLTEAPATVHAEPVATGRDATLVAWTTDAHPQRARWNEEALPLDALAATAGDGAFVKSALVEAETVWLRVVLPETVTAKVLQTRYADAGVDARVLTAQPPRGPPTGRGLSALTPRQEETLRLAHALGYYRTPRACTLETVARTLGVSANAVHKNLTAAEAKIVGNYLAHAE